MKLFNYKGIQFGKVTTAETHRGYFISVDMYFDGLFVGKYVDEGNGGQAEFDIYLPKTDDKKYFAGTKSKTITEDDCIAWMRSMKNTLMNLAKEYLQDKTYGEGYTGFCGEKCYINENSNFEQIMTEFCETYTNGLSKIENYFQKMMNKYKTTELVAIIVPEYVEMGDDKFMAAFKTIYQPNMPVNEDEREMLSKHLCKEYKVKKLFFISLSDFITPKDTLKAGGQNA